MLGADPTFTARDLTIRVHLDPRLAELGLGA